MKTAQKQKAFEFRKQGKSYNEIKVALNVSKSTLSDWLRDHEWSKKVKNLLIEQSKKYHSARMQWLVKAQRNKLKEIYSQGEKEAVEEFEMFKWFPLFIAGICIFWGEGDKISKHQVRIGNVDPRLLKIFVNFLKKVCGIPQNKIRAYVLLYPDLKEKNCLDFWVKNTGLKLENFTKCIIIRGKHKTKRLSYGVCNITVSSSYLKRKMNIWLELLGKELIYKYTLRV
jgi:hypothetical protein